MLPSLPCDMILQVGPKKKNLKVKNFEEFQFRPRELVANICRIYVHLGEDDDSFCRAVSRDGRSYSHALFEQAELVLCKIHESADMIASFSELGRKIQVPSLVVCSMVSSSRQHLSKNDDCLEN